MNTEVRPVLFFDTRSGTLELAMDAFGCDKYGMVSVPAPYAMIPNGNLVHFFQVDMPNNSVH